MADLNCHNINMQIISLINKDKKTKYLHLIIINPNKTKHTKNQITKKNNFIVKKTQKGLKKLKMNLYSFKKTAKTVLIKKENIL